MKQEEKKEAAEINTRIAEKKTQETETFKELNAKLNTIGNIVYQDVPISKDEENNAVVSTWGTIPELKVDGKTLGKLHHHEIMECLDICEFERG
jgi:seryl-tRNA synthetase